MIAKTTEDFKGLKEIGKICGEIREELMTRTKPGMTTKELDDIAKKLFEEKGAQSAPKGEYNFPGYTCISVNEEVAHGIPGDRIIEEGDLMNIDVSGSKNGYFADTGISFVVGKGAEILQQVCNLAKKAFEVGLNEATPGAKKSAIGRAVHKVAKLKGMTVIKDLTGHGIGRSIHEAPDHVFNYYTPWDDEVLKDGMVIALEPFISTYEEEIIQSDDGWTLFTDESIVAQYEHTVIITKKGPIITTL